MTITFDVQYKNLTEFDGNLYTPEELADELTFKIPVASYENALVFANTLATQPVLQVDTTDWSDDEEGIDEMVDIWGFAPDDAAKVLDRLKGADVAGCRIDEDGARQLLVVTYYTPGDKPIAARESYAR